MNEQHGTVFETGAASTAERGFLMFKNHVAAMKSGSKLLRGERETGKAEEQSQESE